ncbi:hypothetical protein SAMN04489731_12139 [Amycolatopsis regifaucium]|nr:hypothetical protein SAMN04489731_12139 [Amycolatopsis regifaucium]
MPVTLGVPAVVMGIHTAARSPRQAERALCGLSCS